MSSIRSYSRRAGSLFAVAALVLATITPGLVPSFASAAQLTERSIALSSSSKEATGVSYTVGFTAVEDAASVVIDFCGNTPLLGAECTTPAGFSTTGITSTGDFTATSLDANTVQVVGAIDVSDENEVSFSFGGIKNPDNAGPIYARIVTYVDATPAYTSAESLGAEAAIADTGSAAISITDSINVSGAVLESMTFCIAGPVIDGSGNATATTIDPNCANAGSLPAPSLRLGKKVGDIVALDGTVNTGSLYGQISTNAASGAVVNLKSDAAGCGGLLRDGAPTACDIAPAQTGGIAEGQARFGARFSPATANLLGLTSYNATTYTLNYNATDQSTGVTSTYGDPIFSTKGLPVSNENLELIFGASVAPNTPAGNYSAGLSLIATGKF